MSEKVLYRKWRPLTFNEVVGGVYQVTAQEIKDLQALPFGKYRLNS